MRESKLISLIAADAAATRALGAMIARELQRLQQPLIIELVGELGAGKTTLVGGLLHELGFSGNAKSPTYTLIEPYEIRGRCVYHLDLYRLQDPREVDALGVRDLVQGTNVLLIEWPERGAGELPQADITVRLRYSGEASREIEMISHSTAGQSVLQGASATATP